jgi:hypothetical protein
MNFSYDDLIRFFSIATIATAGMFLFIYYIHKYANK